MEIKYKKNHARQVITYCYSNFIYTSNWVSFWNCM